MAMAQIINIMDFNNAGRQDSEDECDSKTERTRDVSGFIGAVNAALPESLTQSPIPDGKIHRFGKKKNCWYILFNNAASGVAVGEFGSWSEGIEGKWTNWEATGNYKVDAEYQLMLDTLRNEREKQRVQEKAEAKAKAKEIYEKAQIMADTNSHPYLETKQVKPFGDIRLSNGRLLLPMTKGFGDEKELVSYQTIGTNGEKFFLPGGEKKGTSFVIPPAQGKSWDTVAIVEGYATGSSIHMATGLPVIVAFDAGNLPVVASLYRRANEKARLLVFGDNDANGRGQEAANQAVLWSAGGGGSIALIPEDGGIDWNDAHVMYGLDVLKSYLGTLTEGSGLKPAFRVQINHWTPDLFTGTPPERRMLVSETIPMAAVTLIAAMGDAGKGMIGLDLALKVGSCNILASAFGKEVMTHGMAVVLTAEDDRDEVHRRLKNLGIQGNEQIRVVPLPNTGGILPLVVPGKNGPELSPDFHEIRRQLIELKPKLVIIDPLASFIMADVNADPAVGAFVTGTLSSLAQDTGASIIVAHHMAKTKNQITSPEDARALVRGSTALVDGVRSVYVFWQAAQAETNKICKAIDEKITRNKVFYGCVVKSNGPADREIKTYIRNSIGLLEVRDVLSQKVKDERVTNLDTMEKVIGWAATTGHPFTCMKASGVYENKERIPKQLRSLGRSEINALVATLLDEGRIGKYRLKDGVGREQWLDVNDGVFSHGLGEIASGKAPHWQE